MKHTNIEESPEERLKRLKRRRKWNKECREHGDAIDNNLGLTFNDQVLLLLEELKKLKFEDEDGVIPSERLGFYYDSNAPGTFDLTVFQTKRVNLAPNGLVGSNCNHSYTIGQVYLDLEEDEEVKFKDGRIKKPASAKLRVVQIQVDINDLKVNGGILSNRKTEKAAEAFFVEIDLKSALRKRTFANILPAL